MIPGGISERLYAAYNGHDIDALERLYAADGTQKTLPRAGRSVARAP